MELYYIILYFQWTFEVLEYIHYIMLLKQVKKSHHMKLRGRGGKQIKYFSKLKDMYNELKK